MSDFRQSQRDRAVCFDCRLAYLSGIRRHSRRYIYRDNRFARTVDQSDQTEGIGAKLPRKSRAQNAVDDRVGKSQLDLHSIPRAIAVERLYFRAHRPQNFDLNVERCGMPVFAVEHESFDSSAHIGKISSRHECIAAVISRARRHAHAFFCDRLEDALDRLRHTMSRAFHQRQLGQSVIFDDVFIDCAHLIRQRYFQESHSISVLSR